MASDASTWPLYMLSLDRIDNNRGYELDNLRLILRAHNTIRRRSNHDKGWISWFEHIDQDFVERQAAKALEAGAALPGDAAATDDEDADGRAGEREVARPRPAVGSSLGGRERSTSRMAAPAW